MPPKQGKKGGKAGGGKDSKKEKVSAAGAKDLATTQFNEEVKTCDCQRR